MMPSANDRREYVSIPFREAAHNCYSADPYWQDITQSRKQYS